ncbi:MAG: hypothetical protein GY926_00560 [bacterium]|nr:hypothetical protein [bacterium]
MTVGLLATSHTDSHVAIAAASMAIAITALQWERTQRHRIGHLLDLDGTTEGTRLPHHALAAPRNST